MSSLRFRIQELPVKSRLVHVSPQKICRADWYYKQNSWILGR